MKRTLCVAASLAVLLGATSAAVAQPNYGHDRHDSHQQQDQRYGDRNDHDSRGGFQASGYRHHPEWRKGRRMAQNDWRRGQRVDYRTHHLRAPPRGYEWREVDGNYVLAAAASGLIASIIANSH